VLVVVAGESALKRDGVIQWDTSGPGRARPTERATMTKAHQTHDETDAETDAEAEAPAADHLEDVEDGCGCGEIWEHLIEERERPAADD
jgi:hypothetical protein